MHHGGVASIYYTNCTGDVPLENALCAESAEANQRGNGKAGGKTLHYQDGKRLDAPLPC